MKRLTIIYGKKGKAGIDMPAVYLDACMVIGLIEGDSEQHQAMKCYLSGHVIFSSELVRLEARLLGIRQKKVGQLKLYDAFFSVCEFIDLDRSVFDFATSLRAESNLKAPDALHLAAAINSRCDVFCTNDKQLVKIAAPYIAVVDWDMLLSA